MIKSAAIDFEKIYSMNKPSIIKFIRGVNSASLKAARYFDVKRIKGHVCDTN